MSKMGETMIENKFKYIPKDIVDYRYSEYFGSYTIYFLNGDEYTQIDYLSELDMLIIADALKQLREDG